MNDKSISFRTHLQSNTIDLLNDANVSCTYTVRLVIGLVSQLAAYTEEGVPLSPSVFICNSIANLIAISGSGEHVCLSKGTDTATSASEILKYAAPLCDGGWKIYIERLGNGATCNYGVFCGSNDPSSLTVDDLALEELDSALPVIRVAQNVTNKVEVRTSAGASIEFRFNDDQDILNLNNREYIKRLSTAVAKNIEPPDSSFCGFIERIISDAVRRSHGALIAVISEKDRCDLEALSDAVHLEEPIDLYGRYQLHFKEDKTATSVSRLQAAADLLSGFVNSDGITLLNTRGKVLGYRAFIKINDTDAPIMGGARTRAFAALKSLVGNGLEVAFFRSQDGRMEIETADHGVTGDD